MNEYLSWTTFKFKMMKASVKYLLTLCILLLSVTNQLTAHTQKGGVSFLSQKTLHTSKDLRLDANHQLTITSFSTDGKDNSLFFCEEDNVEEDEERFVLQKKHSEIPCASSFYAWNRLLILLNFPQVLLSYKHFIFFTPNKLFVIFRVFRI